MKNLELELMGVQEMNITEMRDENGGNLWGELFKAVAYDGLKWLICENNYEYGKRLYETGSPGGAK